MFQDNDDQNNEINITNPLFDEQLNEIDRFANSLFILGLHYSFLGLDKADQSLLLKQEQRLTSEEESAFTYEIAKLLSLANRIYLTSGIIILNTSFERLEQLEAVFPQNASFSDEERISGREMITAGNLLKAIGYLLSATGFEMIADSVQKETDSFEG